MLLKRKYYVFQIKYYDIAKISRFTIIHPILSYI